MFGITKINSDEIAVVSKNGKVDRVLTEGRHFTYRPFSGEQISIFSRRDVEIDEGHHAFDEIFESEIMQEYVTTVDIRDEERALIWIDGRYYGGFSAEKKIFFKGYHEIEVEKVKTTPVQLFHKKEDVILNHPTSIELFETYRVAESCCAVWYNKGVRQEILTPGKYAFWKGAGTIKIFPVESRESVIDIQGQDIMSADRVTLRLNAVVSYRVVDPVKSIEAVDDAKQAVYRETQLAIREMVGHEELDALLISKETLSSEIFQRLVKKAIRFGIQINSVGIRDIILPGEMKTLLNKVVEAKKAAEANLITRREESAALRSQANSAKMIESNPTLMRLRELEVLERIAEKSQLQVLLGGGEGLREQVMKLV